MSMTSNAANIAVCNQSLGMLGASEITVGGTTDQNHIYCTTFFDDARDEILAAHKWNFAKKRAYALETTAPIFGYDQAFTYPTDCIRIWQIAQSVKATYEVEGALILTDWGETPPSWVTDTDYIAGQYISSDDSGSDLTYLVDTSFTSDTETTDLASYCTAEASNLSVLDTEYVYPRTDVDAWPKYARQCLVINLARLLAPALKQNEEKALALQTMLYGGPRTTGYLDTARSIDGQEGGAVAMQTYKFIDSRRSWRG